LFLFKFAVHVGLALPRRPKRDNSPTVEVPGVELSGVPLQCSINGNDTLKKIEAVKIFPFFGYIARPFHFALDIFDAMISERWSR
jgi:hypothetical protein